MTLRDNLYVLLFADPASAERCVVRLIPSSPVYAAHFPNYPITPGVLIVQMATELLELREGHSLDLAEAVNVKFISPLFPGDGAEVAFSFTPDGPLRWKVNVSCGEAPCAKMTLQYR